MVVLLNGFLMAKSHEKAIISRTFVSKKDKKKIHFCTPQNVVPENTVKASGKGRNFIF